MQVVKLNAQGFSHKKIADTLGIKVGTVSSRLSRGKKQIAEVLRP
jgi:DNA-directed RNA polymerase specialized sigma24 family protein